ncbi:bifunctional transcriptional activator/DNA repair enzyme AdaA [Yersinia sp. 1652 StPb PI]|uniref:bifunctional transcriptional activator/DNA repair enzyme AdaA n=1 Tax=Yersinia sp. 1652 StPb PI TaxID=3061649 RepID=UPI00355BF8A0
MRVTKHPQDISGTCIEDDPCWVALINRQVNDNEQFVYGVITTGVYCYPCSPTKLPRPENVIFFDSAAEAEAAGFRVSKRVGMDQETLAKKYAAIVVDVCRHIDTSDSLYTLSDLAEKAGLSSSHFHRVFKKITGLTPKEYGQASRGSRVREQLTQSVTITDAMYEAGYNSNSRFYEASQSILGMKPSEYRSGGTNVDIKFAVGECSLGSILVAQSSKGICAILLGDDPALLVKNFQDQFPNANLLGGDTEFETLVAIVVGFIESPDIGLTLPLDIRGTVFQERVWQALREIPVGTTATYADIAVRIGMPTEPYRFCGRELSPGTQAARSFFPMEA